MNSLAILRIIAACLVVGGATAFSFSFFLPWLKARTHRVPVGMLTLLAIRLGGVPCKLVVDARVAAGKVGIALETGKIAARYLAEGRVMPTVRAVIEAQQTGEALNWDRACAHDLMAKFSQQKSKLS